MSDRNVAVREMGERRICGLETASSDRSVSVDIPRLSAEYHAVSGTREGGVLPFYVLSRDYEPRGGTFRLFVGGEPAHEGLRELTLPAGLCAVMAVKPKLGFLWGAAVGEAKRWFYTVWLPQSGYRPQNLEYEYHTEKTLGKKPELDLVFAVEKES